MGIQINKLLWLAIKKCREMFVPFLHMNTLFKKIGCWSRKADCLFSGRKSWKASTSERRVVDNLYLHIESPKCLMIQPANGRRFKRLSPYGLNETRGAGRIESYHN